MKISEILRSDVPTLSFEVFPPKTSDSVEKVRAATEEIAELHPAFMSVTYGAGGGTGEYTLEIAQNLIRKKKVPLLAHLTCVDSTRESILTRLREFRAAGVENVMALRGDIPQSPRLPRESWAYAHANDLMREIGAFGGFCIGGACYPETHPESVSRLDFADGFPLYGDAIDLHASGQIGLGEAHGSSGLMNPISGNVFLSPKVVDFQGITSKLP